MQHEKQNCPDAPRVRPRAEISINYFWRHISQRACSPVQVHVHNVILPHYILGVRLGIGGSVEGLATTEVGQDQARGRVGTATRETFLEQEVFWLNVLKCAE